MTDLMNRVVSIYKVQGGGEIRLTQRQERALQHACVWQTLGYHFSRFCFDAPTYTDAQIVAMCSTYKFIARICRDSFSPFVVVNPHTPDDQPTPCLSFTDAVRCAHEMFRCDVITVPSNDFRPEHDSIADHWRVTILIVD
jgi:hypothetical protein